MELKKRKNKANTNIGADESKREEEKIEDKTESK